MPKKKIAKYQQDIARAQAITASPIDRCEWWQRLARASTLEQITEVVHTPIMPEESDQEVAKTDKEFE